MRDMNKRFAICHPSGTVVFTTNDEYIANNRAAYGWLVKDMWAVP